MRYTIQFLKQNPKLAIIYAYSRFMKERNLRKLTEYKIPKKEIQKIRSNLLSNRELSTFLDRTLRDTSIYGPAKYVASEIYVLCRIMKPDLVVETGVASGYSSTIILQALEDNGKGKLFSIDIGKKRFGRNVGWLVPKELRRRWTLTIGSSQQRLRPLLEKLHQIDVFYHDSLHTYENMMFEYETAWNHLTRGGLLLSHDIGRAFFDFAKKVQQKPTRILYGFGAMKK